MAPAAAICRRLIADRDLLVQPWLASVDEALRLTTAWRKDYDRVRPRASVGHRTPFGFARPLAGHPHRAALFG